MSRLPIEQVLIRIQCSFCDSASKNTREEEMIYPQKLIADELSAFWDWLFLSKNKLLYFLLLLFQSRFHIFEEIDIFDRWIRTCLLFHYFDNSVLLYHHFLIVHQIVLSSYSASYLDICCAFINAFVLAKRRYFLKLINDVLWFIFLV